MEFKLIDLAEARMNAAVEIIGFHDSDRCSVCGAEKWVHAPFCRLCSIALQRMNLMKRLKEILEDSKDATALTDCAEYLAYYDLCRDYLICRRRGL